MRLKGNTVMLIVVLLLSIFVLLYSQLTMDDLESNLLPTLFGAIVMLLTAIALWQDLKKKPAAGAEAGEKKAKGAAPWGRSLINFAWVLGFLAGIFLFGYVIAITVFVIAYMKWLGTRWLTAIIWAVAATAVMYFSFEIGLQLPLYKGIIPNLITG